MSMPTKYLPTSKPIAAVDDDPEEPFLLNKGSDEREIGAGPEPYAHGPAL